MAEKKKCFIIAPITTPPERVSLYGNDVDHCKHVIEHLLIPAAEGAGFEAVPPSAKGAELIHAEIVSKLQDASLVLCDMSGLNPNVFFELGIRTAMNKPVCVVRDDTTDRTPFDMAPINNHTYSSNLSTWIVPGEVEKLSAHIKQSIGVTDNALWKYFGLRIKADSAEREPGPEGKLDLLVSEIDALRRQLREREVAAPRHLLNWDEDFLLPKSHELADPTDSISTRQSLVKVAGRLGLRVLSISPVADGTVSLIVDEATLSNAKLDTLMSLGHELGIRVKVGTRRASRSPSAPSKPPPRSEG